MPEPELESSRTFELLSQQQLHLYGKELQQHFRSERRLREELQEKNRELEQRLQEITALNRLFQKHLCQSSGLIEAYRDAVAKLRSLLEESGGLAERADAETLPACPLHPAGHR